jgi:hypothetical protein
MKKNNESHWDSKTRTIQTTDTNLVIFDALIRNPGATTTKISRKTGIEETEVKLYFKKKNL